jgi:hypothetical protein
MRGRSQKIAYKVLVANMKINGLEDLRIDGRIGLILKLVKKKPGICVRLE